MKIRSLFRTGRTENRRSVHETEADPVPLTTDHRQLIADHRSASSKLRQPLLCASSISFTMLRIWGSIQTAGERIEPPRGGRLCAVQSGFTVWTLMLVRLSAARWGSVPTWSVRHHSGTEPRHGNRKPDYRSGPYSGRCH